MTVSVEHKNVVARKGSWDSKVSFFIFLPAGLFAVQRKHSSFYNRTNHSEFREKNLGINLKIYYCSFDGFCLTPWYGLGELCKIIYIDGYTVPLFLEHCAFRSLADRINKIESCQLITSCNFLRTDVNTLWDDTNYARTN